MQPALPLKTERYASTEVLEQREASIHFSKFRPPEPSLVLRWCSAASPCLERWRRVEFRQGRSASTGSSLQTLPASAFKSRPRTRLIDSPCRGSSPSVVQSNSHSISSSIRSIGEIYFHLSSMTGATRCAAPDGSCTMEIRLSRMSTFSWARRNSRSAIAAATVTMSSSTPFRNHRRPCSCSWVRHSVHAVANEHEPEHRRGTTVVVYRKPAHRCAGRILVHGAVVASGDLDQIQQVFVDLFKSIRVRIIHRVRSGSFDEFDAAQEQREFFRCWISRVT